MRMGMIIISLVFVFIGIDLTMSWGGPFSELADTGKARIMGIDSIRAAIQSRAKGTRRPHNTSRANNKKYSLGYDSQKKKPSLARMLSDDASAVQSLHIERSIDRELKPSSPGQYVSAEYFPASPGTTWAYLMNGLETSNVKVLYENAVVRGVVTSIAVNAKTGVSICYTSDNDGILIHRQLFPGVYIQGVNIVDVIVTFIPPIRLADGVVEVGQAAYSIGTAQYTLLPQRRVIDLDYTATYILQIREEVAVPAGSFDALLFQGTLIISNDLDSETLYVSKGVGLVKDVVKCAGKKKVTELSFTTTEP